MEDKPKTHRRIAPYNYHLLPKITWNEVELYQQLLEFLGIQFFKSDFLPKINQTLSQTLSQTCELWLDSMKMVPKADLKNHFPKSFSLYAVIALEPSDWLIFVEIDPVFASMVVDTLLGGKPEHPKILRPLTEVELGVFSYPLLKFIQVFQLGWPEGQKYALRLKDLQTSCNDQISYLSRFEEFVSFQYKLLFGYQTCYTKLLFPHEFIETINGDNATRSNLIKKFRHALLLKRLNSWDFIESPLRIPLGSCDISLSELKTLGVGDIILIDHHQIKFQPQNIQASVKAFIGKGNYGIIEGQVQTKQNQLEFAIQKITFLEKPSMQKDASETATEQSNIPLEGPQNFVNDMTVSLNIEIGRVEMNVQKITQIKTGQIIPLKKGVRDPVELVVQDRIIGRGELMDIEGQLGVRIIELNG